MIGWMQKHNKYLVWTIWVSTVAFIGAGFVGWGSYSFGSKAGNVAAVGNVEISQKRLNMTYSDLYQKYAAMFPGQFDDAKAKEMGLAQQAFSILQTQALILNYAEELGIIVTDEEVASELAKIPAFQTQGRFDKKVYDAYLSNRRLKAATFEEMLHDQLLIDKTLKLLHLPPLSLEVESISAAMRIADDIAYTILTPDDINVTVDEKGLRAYWQQHKEEFKTPERFRLAIVWTPGDAAEIDKKELFAFYQENSFNYTDESGKILPFEKAKEALRHDLKLKKSKKIAQKAYIDFKKGKREADETVELAYGDPKLSESLWNEIKIAHKGDILKPKRVEERYATVTIREIFPPRTMSFEEAKPALLPLYNRLLKEKALDEAAQKYLQNIMENSEYHLERVTIRDIDKVKGLNRTESLQFLQNLFTSLKEKGIIRLQNKHIVYRISKQTLIPQTEITSLDINATVNKTKQGIFDEHLIDILSKRYPTEVYMGGLVN